MNYFFSIKAIITRIESRNTRALPFLFTVLFLFAQSVFSQAPETVRIQLKWYHQFQFAGFYAAVEQGYYEDEGLNVILQERDANIDHISAVINGEAEYGVADAGLLLVRKQGAPVVLVAQIFQHSPQVFITLKDSGIISPYEMKNKKVMLDKAFQDDTILTATLNDMLGTLDNVVDIPRSYGQEVEQLIAGDVDVIGGYMSNEPFVLQEKGYPVNITDGYS